MIKVNKKIKKHRLRLVPDKLVERESFLYPVTWKGWFGSYRIEVIHQKDSSGNIKDFQFTQFPTQFFPLKRAVMKAIKERMQLSA